MFYFYIPVIRRKRLSNSGDGWEVYNWSRVFHGGSWLSSLWCSLIRLLNNFVINARTMASYETGNKISTISLIATGSPTTTPRSIAFDWLITASSSVYCGFNSRPVHQYSYKDLSWFLSDLPNKSCGRIPKQTRTNSSYVFPKNLSIKHYATYPSETVSLNTLPKIFFVISNMKNN